MKKRLLVASPLKPFVWKRFIFSLWKIPMEEVSIFVNFANSFHLTINFTCIYCEMSSQRGVFLDTDVFKGPRLSTRKPGSHLCDKHNTSEISISISTRKNLVLMLMLISLVLCFLHKCKPGFRILDSQTHFKPTETFQYTHFSSCHPFITEKGFIEGEALCLLTNSVKENFCKYKRDFEQRLCNRGNPTALVHKILTEVQFSDRTKALRNKTKRVK